MAFYDVSRLQFVSPFGGTNNNSLLTVDTDVRGRNLGELLLEDDAINVAAAVDSTVFDTEGHQYLLITIVNPTWATNPTGLDMSIHISTDNFDTEDMTLLAIDGVEIVHALPIADAAQHAMYFGTLSNAGALAATNTPHAAPIPDVDGVVMRLHFVPAGAGITNETITVNVYGITGR